MFSDDTVQVAIAIDKTFVPKALPPLGSPDPRELGVRVFHLRSAAVRDDFKVAPCHGFGLQPVPLQI
jgi:hypothetical protein